MRFTNKTCNTVGISCQRHRIHHYGPQRFLQKLDPVLQVRYMQLQLHNAVKSISNTSVQASNITQEELDILGDYYGLGGRASMNIWDMVKKYNKTPNNIKWIVHSVLKKLQIK